MLEKLQNDRQKCIIPATESHCTTNLNYNIHISVVWTHFNNRIEMESNRSIHKEYVLNEE